MSSGAWSLLSRPSQWHHGTCNVPALNLDSGSRLTAKALHALQVAEFSVGLGYIGALDHLPKAPSPQDTADTTELFSGSLVLQVSWAAAFDDMQLSCSETRGCCSDPEPASDAASCKCRELQEMHTRILHVTQQQQRPGLQEALKVGCACLGRSIHARFGQLSRPLATLLLPLR